MYYKKYHPPDAFNDLIQFFWEYKNDFTTDNAYHQPIEASIFPKLAFQYTGEMGIKLNSGKPGKLFRSGIQAQTDTFSSIFTSQSIGIFGIYFNPIAIPVLFGIPAVEITNHNIEISDLLGSEGKNLEERIMLSNSTKERLRIVIEFLFKRLRSLTVEEKLIQHTINAVYDNNGLINSNQLSDYLYLSPKQVERKFYKFTGFSPKQFSKIVRFESSISAIFRGHTTLTSLACDLGYYDQSHFIKNFKEFTGLTPKDYFSNEDLSIFMES